MTLDIRILSDEADMRRAASVFRTSLVGVPQPPDDLNIRESFEADRTHGAFVDGELAGTAGAYTSWLVAPGGDRLPHAAVTYVGVLPTHTRRGILTGLMREQLADFTARGEVVASLRASEAVIYGRFGYGLATSAVEFELTRARAAVRPEVPAGGPVRLVDMESAWKLMPQIYAGKQLWVGAVDRPDYWWRSQRKFTAPGALQYVLVHGEPGAEDGFLRYQAADQFWDEPRTISVTDLFAASETAFAGLVRYLASIDLVERIKIGYSPTDSLLPYFFTDPRAVRTTAVHDETWLRLVDVPAALSRRSYGGTEAVTIAVTDPLLPANTGTYKVSPSGAARTDDAPDLSVDVTTLGALYLGGPRWWQLARAGRVEVRTPDAVARADALFRLDAAPFAGTYF